MKIDVLKIILNEVDVPTSKIKIGLSNGDSFEFDKYWLDLIKDKLLNIQNIAEFADFEEHYYFDIEQIIYIKNAANEEVGLDYQQQYSEFIKKQRDKNKK